MRIYFRFLSWILLGTLVISSKPDLVNDPDPLVDGKSCIVSIAFPGIPKEDVTIDQKNFLITVKVPPVLLSEMPPVIEVTEGSKVVYYSERALFIGVLFEPSEGGPIYCVTFQAISILLPISLTYQK